MNSQEAITLLRNLEDALDSYCELNEEGKNAFRMAITALNCSEFPNNWISCNERMPEEDNWLGGSGKQFSSNVLVSIVNRSDEDSWVDVSHTIDGEWALELPRYCKILAWQKLPEPYRGD